MFRKILQDNWGHDDFRGIQREIIESIVQGHDTLGLMPTGGGKSIAFQVPALAMEGVCVVVTPLIALMKDQVMQLRRRGIQAAAVYSGMSHGEVLKVLDNCVLGGVKLLYVSPERLSSELFKLKLNHMKVSFITVDEAHCISQWGYDFRPSYLAIADIRKMKPDAPVLALTATATPEVMDDIQLKLDFREKRVFSMSFERKNLVYVVRDTDDKDAELVHILNSVAGSAIVYTRSRRRTAEVAQMLCEKGISATFYHAGLEHAVRDKRQRQWIDDEVRVMVATNAFGMGIDKPNVRLVVHRECPDSVESYFQEAGRAGRDGRKSWAVLLYNRSDESKLRRRIADSYPAKEVIRDIYEHLAYFFQVAMGFGKHMTYPFDIERFCLTYKYFPTVVASALHILQNAGYIEYETDPDTKARLRFLLGRDGLYMLQNVTPAEDRAITALLRLYGGLFVDYEYIDEALVAQAAGMEQNELYLVLKSLSRERIIHFIPQRKMPYITYSRERREAATLTFPPSVYEERRRQMERRVASMISYATNSHVCRSRQLLGYFGETAAGDCGCCDVCIARRGGLREETVASASGRIVQLLADGKRHHVSELDSLRLPHKQMECALARLAAEEKLATDGSRFWLP